jgi:hypothetical protein
MMVAAEFQEPAHRGVAGIGDDLRHGDLFGSAPDQTNVQIRFGKCA